MSRRVPATFAFDHTSTPRTTPIPHGFDGAPG
jgi:hypothetical protein